VTSAARFRLMPGVYTMMESGVAFQAESTTWGNLIVERPRVGQPLLGIGEGVELTIHAGTVGARRLDILEMEIARNPVLLGCAWIDEVGAEPVARIG